MKRIGLVFLLFLQSSGLVALADFELLLEDGQVLSGVEVRREHGQYLLQLENGRVLPIPEELVAEVRITAGSASGVRKAEPEQLAGTGIDLDDDERPASGLRKARPEVLAGENVRPPRTSEQIEALGAPSRSAGTQLDPDWRPESGWDESTDVTEFNPSLWPESPIDPEWEPESDYTQKSDVTEFDSSQWLESILDPRWVPEDGFRTTGRFDRQDTTRPTALTIPTATTCTWCPRFELVPITTASRRDGSLPRGASTADEIRSCAKQIFEPLVATRSSSEAETRESPEHLRVTFIASEVFARLPIQLYESAWAEGGSMWRALFTYSAGDCRLIGGDLADLLGVDVSEEQAADYGTTAYNGALATQLPDAVRLDSDRDKIEYALAVSALIVPGSEGLQLLTNSSQLALGDDPDCRESRRTRRKGGKKVSRSFAEPRVEAGAAADVVTFYSWSRVSGVVWSHRVLLLHGGEITMRCEPVASHLGDHECETTEHTNEETKSTQS